MRVALVDLGVVAAAAVLLFAALADPPRNSESSPQTPHATQSWRQSFTDLPDADHNPTQVERDQMRVEWKKPTIITFDGRPSDLELRGRLVMKSEDGRTKKPVDWPQPIRVIIARDPDDTLDWNKSHRPNNTTGANGVAGLTSQLGPDAESSAESRDRQKSESTGAFWVRLPLSEIHLAAGKDELFQVGLCLGVKHGQVVTWTTDTPVLPASVLKLQVGHDVVLSKTMQLIVRCPTPLGWGYDPAAAIRAANHLRSLGKDKAVVAMREFLKIARDGRYQHADEQNDARNIDTSNQECLATLVPLVFELASTDKSEPARFRERITIQDGIPFHNTYFRGGSGGLLGTGRVVDWAESSGKIIDGILKPTDHPLEAADTAFEKLARATDNKSAPGTAGQREHLRAQAWRMIEAIVEPRRRDQRKIHDELFRSDEDWNELKAKVAKLNIHWDEKLQEYVANKSK